jgi:hypothetical protein
MMFDFDCDLKNGRVSPAWVIIFVSDGGGSIRWNNNKFRPHNNRPLVNPATFSTRLDNLQ